MEKTPIGNIRKIIIGQDPKNSMAYELGREFTTPAGKIKIVFIEEDQNNFYFFGNIRYNIWASVDGKQKKIWKYYERMPITIEYEI